MKHIKTISNPKMPISASGPLKTPLEKNMGKIRIIPKTT